MTEILRTENLGYWNLELIWDLVLGNWNLNERVFSYEDSLSKGWS